MKTTLELPDSILRRTKARAAMNGQSMTAFIKAALEAKLSADEATASDRPWMEFAGIFKDSENSKRLMDAVEESCGQIEAEDWR